MSLVPLRLILDHAAENQYGVPAFNVNNLEQVQAIMEAAHETNSPVVLQVSRGARKYAGENFIRHLILSAAETWPHIPVVLHQDHGNSPATCYSAIRLGFTSVMMDGSLLEDAKTPAEFEYNVSIPREVVNVAYKIGVSVEGELGCLGPLETMRGDKEDGLGAEGTLTKEQLLTDPEEAKKFVELTHVDALAVAIGTSHGAYKFKQKPSGEVLVISRIKEIAEKIPNTHLVMHGSSSVPEELRLKINEFGGNIPENYGVPIEEIQKAIKYNVRKINIDTDLRLAWTAAVREVMYKNPSEFDPSSFLKPAIKAMKEVCKHSFEAFSTAGNADKIKIKTLEDFSKFYQN